MSHPSLSRLARDLGQKWLCGVPRGAGNGAPSLSNNQFPLLLCGAGKYQALGIQEIILALCMTLVGQEAPIGTEIEFWNYGLELDCIKISINKCDISWKAEISLQTYPGLVGSICSILEI